MTTGAINTVIDLGEGPFDLSPWAEATFWEGSLDPGSGITTGYLQPVTVLSKNNLKRGPIFRLSFPSVVATGENLLKRIANARGALNPASCLQIDEFVLQFPDDPFEHLVGNLATREGTHPTDAKGDQNRYWGQHIKNLALAVFGAMIPAEKAEIHMNFCMPYSLFTTENKALAKSNLDGLYRFYSNGRLRNLDIRVGSVIPEGYAAIYLFGSEDGRNVGIDVGDRTVDICFADGYTIVSRDSGGELYGVRQVIEAIQEEYRTVYGKSVTVDDVRRYLKTYTAHKQLPALRVPKGSAHGFLESTTQYELIGRKILPVARAIGTYVRTVLNKEGAILGSNLDAAIIYGGGGYIFHDPLRNGIPGDPELGQGVLRDLLYLPDEAEYLNASYMLSAVADLTEQAQERGIDLWKRQR